MKRSSPAILQNRNMKEPERRKVKENNTVAVQKRDCKKELSWQAAYHTQVILQLILNDNETIWFHRTNKQIFSNNNKKFSEIECEQKKRTKWNSEETHSYGKGNLNNDKKVKEHIFKFFNNILKLKI